MMRAPNQVADRRPGRTRSVRPGRLRKSGLEPARQSPKLWTWPSSDMFMYHHMAWLIEFLTNRTLPSAMATITPPVCRLRALACWNGQVGQAPMPPFGSLMHPSQSSALSSMVFGTVSSQVDWPAITLAPGNPMAHVPRGSSGLRCDPVRTSAKRTVLDAPSGIRAMFAPQLMHIRPPPLRVVGSPPQPHSLVGLAPPSVVMYPTYGPWMPPALQA